MLNTDEEGYKHFFPKPVYNRMSRATGGVKAKVKMLAPLGESGGGQGGVLYRPRSLVSGEMKKKKKNKTPQQ